MTITIDADLVALLIIGFIAGTAAASLAGSRSAARMWLRNGVLGVLGAFLGSAIFDLLDVTDDIPHALMGTITVADILVAIVGAIILIVAARRVT
jgi:uncharacterized membrane protein YeaQ/YmgE (transglycosylase-associated protein family)